MRRIALPLIAVALAAAGAAAAQPAGGRDGYEGGAYPQAAPRDGQDRDGYDQGYDEGDRTPPATGAADAGYGAGGVGAPDLGRDLGLRPDQQVALRAYQQATTPSAADQARMEAQSRALAGMTTPQRLDAIAAQMRSDEADFANRAAAVRRFYVQLTPAQQRRFDQLTSPDPEGGANYDGEGAAAAGAMPR